MEFSPNFKITSTLTKYLMDIEASRQAVSALPITAQILTSLRESARLTATHYSTQIEGNRLTQKQVKEVLRGGAFPNRERDELEVKNYFLALEYVDGLIEQGNETILEDHIQTIHGLVFRGKEKPTFYRDGQNVIKDSSSGQIIYMPPEAKDVPELMKALVSWMEVQKNTKYFPVPIVAAIVHYQFATIHPYYDGNGRTARLLTNLILHKWGYGLKGIYSLEEYYARDLQSYYDALTVGKSHNYYMGRAEADISEWIVYFCEGMADAFSKVCSEASQASKQDNKVKDYSSLLRELDARQKQVLTLFGESRYITTKEIAMLLGLHPRTTLNLCKKWIEKGFLVQHGDANKSRKYELVEKWTSLL